MIEQDLWHVASDLDHLLAKLRLKRMKASGVVKAIGNLRLFYQNVIGLRTV